MRQRLLKQQNSNYKKFMVKTEQSFFDSGVNVDKKFEIH